MANFMEEGLEIAVGIMAIVLLAAYLLPVAFDAWFNASTGTWSSDVASLWDLVPLLALLALLLFFIGYAVYSAFSR